MANIPKMSFINWIPAAWWVLPILNGVLDYRKKITNPFTAEVITASEGFGVIAAINEGYIGTTPLNEALKNRFIVIDVPF